MTEKDKVKKEVKEVKEVKKERKVIKLVNDEKKQKDIDINNIVLIGNKDFMNYVSAAEFQFRKADTIVIRSRGRYISRAVDISQVMVQRYGAKIENIEIGYDEFMNKEKGKMQKTSTIDITISKKGGSKNE